MPTPALQEEPGARPLTERAPETAAGPDAARVLHGIRELGVALLDAGGIVRSWNTGATLITGLLPDEAIGREAAQVLPRADPSVIDPQDELTLARRHGRIEDESWRLRKDALAFCAQLAVSRLPGEDPPWFVLTFRDVTDRHHAQERLRATEVRTRQLYDQAIRDPLTGAFNRRHLFQRLTPVIGYGGGALLLLDVDGFKDINDRCGHEAGDNVLGGLTVLMEKQLRDTDLVFRTGGDEFLVYLAEAAAGAAERVAERLRAAIAEAPLLPGRPVSISIGVATLAPGDTLDGALKRADHALYSAKRRGRDCVVLAD